MGCSICKQDGHNKRSCKVPAPKLKRKTTIKVKPESMNWIPWTDKSKNVLFKSNINGIGDGEKKVSCELETNVLGQNSPFDMKPIINGVPTCCDVKKLDTQNDFNTGVKGRDALRDIKMKLINLFQSICFLSKSKVFTTEETKLLEFFVGVSPDELAVGTICKLKAVCQMLNTRYTNILESIHHIQPIKDLPVMSLYQYYNICEILQLPFPSEYSSHEPTLKFLKYMDNVYIQEPSLIGEDLDNLVNCLKDITLIVVNEKKGYMFIHDIRRVKFMRITRGHPRFQIKF